MLSDRIKEIRKTLNLKQAEFGGILGVREATVTSWETGVRSPSEAVMLAICREFHVNEFWLRTGEGEMFSPRTRDTELADFFGDLLADEPDFRHRLISVLSRLSTDEWELLERMAQKLVEEEQKEKAGP